MFFKIVALKSFEVIHMKTLVLESLFNDLAGLQALSCCNFIKTGLQHRRFPVNSAKLLRMAFYRTPPMVASGFSPSIAPLIRPLVSIKKFLRMENLYGIFFLTSLQCFRKCCFAKGYEDLQDRAFLRKYLTAFGR